MPADIVIFQYLLPGQELGTRFLVAVRRRLPCLHSVLLPPTTSAVRPTSTEYLPVSAALGAVRSDLLVLSGMLYSFPGYTRFDAYPYDGHSVCLGQVFYSRGRAVARGALRRCLYLQPLIPMGLTCLGCCLPCFFAGSSGCVGLRGAIRSLQMPRSPASAGRSSHFSHTTLGIPHRVQAA